jgi:hypothetical protein
MLALVTLGAKRALEWKTRQERAEVLRPEQGSEA